jgi:hypothetical protein
MGGSTADTPTTPESLRASDAERDHAVGELRNEFVDGRMSHETFMYRTQTALAGGHRGQRTGLFTRRAASAWRREADGQDPGPAVDSAGRRAFVRAGAPRIPPPPHMPGRVRRWLPFATRRRRSPPRAAGVPPGSGVRFTIKPTDCDLCLTDLSIPDAPRWSGVRRLGAQRPGTHNGPAELLAGPRAVRGCAGDRVEFGSMAFIIQDDQPAAPGGQREDEGIGPGHAGAGERDAEPPESEARITVLLVRHGLTATTGHVPTGWTPGFRSTIAAVSRRWPQRPGLAALPPTPSSAARWNGARPRRRSRRPGTPCRSSPRTGLGSRYGLDRLAAESWRACPARSGPPSATFPADGSPCRTCSTGVAAVRTGMPGSERTLPISSARTEMYQGMSP